MIPSSACQNCGHRFESFGEKVCPGCGRVRAERTMTGASVESYTVKRRDGSEIGPVPLEAVRQMLDQGVIDGDTPIRVGMEGRVIFADQLPPPPKATTFHGAPKTASPTVKPCDVARFRKSKPLLLAAAIAVFLFLTLSVGVLRGTAAELLNLGKPATVIGGEIATSPEDVRTRKGTPLYPVTNVRVLSQDGDVCFVRVTDDGHLHNQTGYVLARKTRDENGRPLDPSVEVPQPGDVGP